MSLKLSPKAFSMLLMGFPRTYNNAANFALPLIRSNGVYIMYPPMFCLGVRMSSHIHNDSLPSGEESKRSNMGKAVSEKLDNWQIALFTASQRLNDLTGYSGIDNLKRQIEEQERSAALARQRVLAAKAAYKDAIAKRAASQKEVNELLHRKHAWTAADLERFTALYRSDHANEQEETQMQSALAEAERESDEASAVLSRTILVRYHEEQIWSDKIRRASTWGTWALMGINLVLFVVVQLGLEPWKRRRLVGNFEEKIRLIITEQTSKTAENQLAQVSGAGISHDRLTVLQEAPQNADDFSDKAISRALEAIPVSDETPEEENTLLDDQHSSLYGRLKHSVVDIFAERELIYRKVDVSIMMLESAAVGVLVSILAMTIFQSR